MDRFVVQENAVMLFAVLSKRLAMIGHDCNKGVVESSSFSQIVDQLSNDRVGVGNFSIVGFCLIASSIRLRRSVRVVRVVEMNPKKKRTTGMLAQPHRGTAQHLFSATLQAVIVVFAVAPAVKPGVVHVKTPLK